MVRRRYVICDMPIVTAWREHRLVGFLVSSPKGATRHLPLGQAKFSAYPAEPNAILGHYASLPRNEGRVWSLSCSTCRDCSCRVARAWHSSAGTTRLRVRRTAKAVFEKWRSSHTQVSTTLWRHGRLHPQRRAARYGVECLSAVQRLRRKGRPWQFSDLTGSADDVCS
jgi:hypothetical protein